MSRWQNRRSDVFSPFDQKISCTWSNKVFLWRFCLNFAFLAFTATEFALFPSEARSVGHFQKDVAGGISLSKTENGFVDFNAVLLMNSEIPFSGG